MTTIFVFLRVFTSPRIDLEGCVVRGVTGAAGLSYEARINESKNQFQLTISPGKQTFSLRAPRGDCLGHGTACSVTFGCLGRGVACGCLGRGVAWGQPLPPARRMP